MVSRGDLEAMKEMEVLARSTHCGPCSHEKTRAAPHFAHAYSGQANWKPVMAASIRALKRPDSSQPYHNSLPIGAH